MFSMYAFLIERLMGLFWVMVQQFCFACLKYAHDDIVFGNGRVKRLSVSQALSFALLVVFCFEYELGIAFASKALRIGKNNYYPWTVRVILCGTMILFDSLLVLYFARVVRVYRRGLSSVRPTWPGDMAVVAFVVALCGGYMYFSITAAMRLGFGMSIYLWIGRFFIQISNFFYIALEVGGVLLIWSFLRQVVKDEGLESA